MKILMKILKKILLALIWIYRNGYSKFRSPCCRYIPSCSEYAIEAITKYGPFKGTYLAVRRILRCNPWTKRDLYDPVP